MLVSSSMIRTWRVDPAREQRGEGPGQPAGHLVGEVHLPGRGQRGQVQLCGQLVGGEMILQAGAGVAGGELRDRGRQRPGSAGLQPPGGGDDPHQLIIGQARHPRTVLAGHGADHGGQQRARRHRVRGAALGEPGQGQLLRRQGHVQALLGRALPVVLRTGSLGRGRQRGAAGLLGVAGREGEQVLGPVPPSVQKKLENTQYEHYGVNIE
jgi:hypothetical protein